MSLSIEPMTVKDLDAVLSIERASFPTPWSREAFLYELRQNQAARSWAARAETGVVGYLCLWELGTELHITNLAVRPDCRRQGIARTLIGTILEDARRRGFSVALLEVRPSNEEARGLYQRFGFQVVARRKGYYFDTGEDALVMEATLTAAPAGNQPGD
ncbi:MAG: ribosomal protein S18-alanine N-acetyltransferase [Candidatus Methylomirabilia bacterium]